MQTGKKIKQENYTAVADFMLASFERDLADFTKVFKTIDSDFLAAFKEANNALKNISSPYATTQKQKAVTQSIYEQADAFCEKLTLLNAYTKRANMNIPLLKETIAALKSRNIEKVVKNTREMLPFFIENADKIKDMPSDFLSDVPNTIIDFESKNTQQNLLMSQRKQDTAERKPLYDALYHYIKEVSYAGKIVYKSSSKKDDYTISKILTRMDVIVNKPVMNQDKTEE